MIEMIVVIERMLWKLVVKKNDLIMKIGVVVFQKLKDNDVYNFWEFDVILLFCVFDDKIDVVWYVY